MIELRRDGRMWHYTASLISGMLLSLAFPKANQHWIAWFAIAPLMYYTNRLRWKPALVAAFAFGFGFNICLLYWIGVFGRLPLVLLSMIEALYVVLFAALAKAVGSRTLPWARLVLLPALWVSVEWLNSLWITAFPWGTIGYSQYRTLPMVQISSLTGVWGVSFVLATSNAAVAGLAEHLATDRKRWAGYTQILPAMGLIVAVWGYGVWQLSESSYDGTRVRVAVVQGSANPSDHDADDSLLWKTYLSLTRESADQGTDLIVWPEGTIPGDVVRDPRIREKLVSLASTERVCLLAGGHYEDEKGKEYNCAFVIQPGGDNLQKYAKVHLVPFGEFVPLRGYIPLVERYRVTPYDITPGRELKVLAADDLRIGVVICFESIFPQISRTLTDAGAEILCVITNDAWFGRTAAAEQHLAKSVFRAIENRRWVVRGAATGVSCIIAPDGSIRARTDLFREQAIAGSVARLSTKTFYTRHGEWLVYLYIAAGVVTAIISFRRGISGSERHPRDP